jgi:amidase
MVTPLDDGSGRGRDAHEQSTEISRLGAADLQRLMDDGSLSSVEVTSRLLERIDAIDRSGPAIRSVLRLADDAMEQAADRDEQRAGGTSGPLGALHGLPVLVKDNIDTAGPLGTTAGSLALDQAPPATDAPVVSLLRQAGAVILGKANLSEWAGFRGRPASSGWSAVGGQTRNPFALDRTPGGSSGGSGAAVAAGLTPLALGTETDGSINCPAAACGVVGLKPTVGLVSRTGIVPISASQDTAGPMARSVRDIALLLGVLSSAPPDGEDEATPTAGHRSGPRDYMGALQPSLEGIRVGVVRDAGYAGYDTGTDQLVDSILGAFGEAGGEVIDPVTGLVPISAEDELTVLCHEFKAGLAAYLARRANGRRHAGGLPDGSPSGLPSRLEDVISFNETCEDELLSVFPQDHLERAAAAGGLDDPGYLAAREANLQRTRQDGIDAILARYGLDALVAPSMPPAFLIDHVAGDHYSGASWSEAAIAGYPSISVPIGQLHGLPVGLTIWGRAWSEHTLIRIAYALERQLAVTSVPGFLDSIGYLA